MNIVMMTNTYCPHVGGVARSVKAFSEEYCRLGHNVLVVAPEFAAMPDQETRVIRIPAIQNFNASDFSVVLPFAGLLQKELNGFQPDIVHSHHPFLLGMTALRTSRSRSLPMIFTHHTLYEQYTHYVPGDSPTMKRFAIELATAYANLCDRVFAPSESIARLLRKRGVFTPISEIQTGVAIGKFADGDGVAFRKKHAIPADAYVVGHLGRLAPEKNLVFLAEVLAEFLAVQPRAHCLIIGTGPAEASIHSIFERANLDGRLAFAGVLHAGELADALHAMDVFAFASKSETQGMVLTEAMAAGLPVVALDASGVREVVSDGINGRLLMSEEQRLFVEALVDMATRTPKQQGVLRQAARATAKRFSMRRCAERALAAYAETKPQTMESVSGDQALDSIIKLIRTEWDIIRSVAEAGSVALLETTSSSEHS